MLVKSYQCNQHTLPRCRWSLQVLGSKRCSKIDVRVTFDEEGFFRWLSVEATRQEVDVGLPFRTLWQASGVLQVWAAIRIQSTMKKQSTVNKQSMLHASKLLAWLELTNLQSGNLLLCGGSINQRAWFCSSFTCCYGRSLYGKWSVICLAWQNYVHPLEQQFCNGRWLLEDLETKQYFSDWP